MGAGGDQCRVALDGARGRDRRRQERVDALDAVSVERRSRGTLDAEHLDLVQVRRLSWPASSWGVWK